jgi:hypothetical protein
MQGEFSICLTSGIELMVSIADHNKKLVGRRQGRYTWNDILYLGSYHVLDFPSALWCRWLRESLQQPILPRVKNSNREIGQN